MSSVLNKLATLLATLVVVGVALFWSSAAEAHSGHGIGSVVAVAADETSASVEKVVPNVETTLVDTDDTPDAQHRAGTTTCCGTGVSNCMSATLACPEAVLAMTAPGSLAPARVFRSLVGVTVDGLIRPPKALV